MNREQKKVIIIAIIVLFLGASWTSGRLDHALVNIGLNYNDCARNGFGATMCGDELKEYEQRLNDAGIDTGGE